LLFFRQQNVRTSDQEKIDIEVFFPINYCKTIFYRYKFYTIESAATSH